MMFGYRSSGALWGAFFIQESGAAISLIEPQMKGKKT
jgi:hypothetical protein